MPFDPSCTKPCTGISADTGIVLAMTAIKNTPPPMPRVAVIKEVNADIPINNNAVDDSIAPDPVIQSKSNSTMSPN
ncbi:hypothetical protein KUL49_03710 [Alteromonas sp. KUL49]|nr:hypothetical protein KUL49_03710 [Alteromonas sp. KUL49]